MEAKRNESPRLLWNLRESAKAIGVSGKTLQTWAKRGKVPCVRIGSRVLYDPQDLQRWIEKLKTGSITAATAA